MSTQVFGNYEKVMSCLTAQMKETFEKHGKNVFVMKVLPGDLDQLIGLNFSCKILNFLIFSYFHFERESPNFVGYFRIKIVCLAK